MRTQIINVMIKIDIIFNLNLLSLLLLLFTDSFKHEQIFPSRQLKSSANHIDRIVSTFPFKQNTDM